MCNPLFGLNHDFASALFQTMSYGRNFRPGLLPTIEGKEPHSS